MCYKPRMTRIQRMPFPLSTSKGSKEAKTLFALLVFFDVQKKICLIYLFRFVLFLALATSWCSRSGDAESSSAWLGKGRLFTFSVVPHLMRNPRHGCRRMLKTSKHPINPTNPCSKKMCYEPRMTRIQRIPFSLSTSKDPKEAKTLFAFLMFFDVQKNLLDLFQFVQFLREANYLVFPFRRFRIKFGMTC